MQKLDMGLLFCENHMILESAILSEYTRVTDNRPNSMTTADRCIASDGVCVIIMTALCVFKVVSQHH